MFGLILGVMGAPSDAELVRRFKSGDRAAYAEIVRRYQNRVYAQCLRWLGEPHLAEETAQDVFLALFRSLADFRGDAQLSTWIWRVAVNHCKNRRLYGRRRHEGRHEPLEGTRDDDDAPKRQFADDGPATDIAVHQSESERLVREALERLDPEDRSIIVMRDVEDLSYEQISEILDLPRGTVKSRLHRARADLARVLSKTLTREDVL
jgi:RNA polymerase sigma-70 factor (ECF subfamily)